MKTITRTLMLILMMAGSGYAANLGTFGKTYPIAEPNGIEEIQNAAARVDWEKYFNRKTVEEKVTNYKPSDHITLPKATKERVRLIDPTYTLGFDIPDPNTGEILYPKGFSFNPLDYMTFTKKVVVIDGSDKEQVDWLIKSKYAKDPTTILLITGGVFYEVSEQINRAVFFATKKIADRFQFEYVPSIAYQNSRMMEVVEVDVTKKQ